MSLHRMACRLARAAVCSSCTHLSSLTNGLSAQPRRQHFQIRVFRKSFPAKKSLHFSARSLLVGQTDSTKKTAAPSTNTSSEISAGSLDDNPMTWPSRSHGCGTLGEADVGVRVRICGWVASQRSHGGVAFVNVRDHTGIVQVPSAGLCYACLRNPSKIIATLAVRGCWDWGCLIASDASGSSLWY